jgi:hypothetical protein
MEAGQKAWLKHTAWQMGKEATKKMAWICRIWMPYFRKSVKKGSRGLRKPERIRQY